MKSKKEKIIFTLGIILGIQVLLILALNVFSLNNIKLMSIEKKLMSGFKKESIVSLEIMDAKDTFLISKKGPEWFVKRADGREIPADTVKLDNYLTMLSKTTTGIIRDKNPNEASDKIYGFDPDSIQKITIKNKKNKEFVLSIGNPGKQKGYSYVIYADKAVREVKSTVSVETGNTPISWGKKEILDNVTVEDIEKCDIDAVLPWFLGKYNLKKNPDKTADEKDKDKDAFVFEPAFSGKLVQFSAENIVRNLIFLRIDDYKFDADLTTKEKKATINITLKNGKTYQFSIYSADKGDAGDYIIDVDFNNYLYLVDENDLKRVIKPRDELFEKLK